MRLKSLEIHGFKSFPDRTKINFSEGMTVIVGPNGSGKSNISDAIRWVLGEISAKNIRGNKLEDVIFGGTDGRSPMSFAEVSLNIENSGDNRIDSDFDEIKVTRRYYRSGDSEYLINNKAARLRDITEMFMNTGIGKTGYSIVGQGQVSSIISQKSEERRIIFEEAAGISKYRVKKQEAERRLSETDDNLVRITDIVNELGGRIGPLEKDAAKARVYLDLYEKKKALDISLAVYDIEKINENLKLVEKDHFTSGQELELADDAIAAYETRLEALSRIQLENRSEYEQSSSASGELTERLHTLEGTLLVDKNELSHQKELDGSLKAALEDKKSDKNRQSVEISKLIEKCAYEQGELERMNAWHQELLTKLDTARADYQHSEEALEKLEVQKSEILRLHTDARISLSVLSESANTLTSRKDELTESIANADTAISLTKKRVDASNETLSGYIRRQNELTEQKKQLMQKDEQRHFEHGEMENRYNALLADISAKEQRALTLRRMEEHFDGYSRSVRFVAEAAAAGRIRGICGPVSQLISVDRRYSVAIETALGANLQNIVVENEAAAKSAIALLKRENQGRSTFYPITSMRPASLNLAASVKGSAGYIGIASELINFDKRYFPVISSLLGRTLIFDNLDNASIVAKSCGYSYRIVTLDGQVINAGGSFTGGSVKRDSGILTRSVEIEEILASKRQSENAAAELKEKLVASSTMFDENKGDLDKLSEDISLIAALCKAEETGLNMNKNRLREQQAERAKLVAALEGLNDQEHEKEKQRITLTNNCKSYEQTEAAIQSEMSAALNVKNEADRVLTALITAKNDSTVAVSVKNKELEVLRRELDNMTAAKATSDDEIVDIEARLTQCSDRIAALTEKITVSERLQGELSAKIGENRSKEQELTQKSLEIEKEQSELRQKSKDESRLREQIFTRYTTLSAKLESAAAEKTKLTDKIWDEYEISFADAKQSEFEPVTEVNRSKKVGEQTKLRSKIRELGSVNVGAIEEYSSVKERYEFLSGQVNDLTKSKKEFTDIISKLEVEMCTRFSETFEKVNENFKEVFRELFGGGSGSLSLTDPENVLTSGIEINVTPPGKIIHNIKLLSGGEQVFVAIGIFFAILKVNPSPFCLLDEIESALDEVNVDRFAAYAKEFTGNTQFIIITHRRGTMEEADTLYGVTMQEKGISKILSISVNEVEQRLGVKL